MKKIIASLAILSLIAACDDGDLIYEDLNFAETSVNACGFGTSNILYKLNADQAFILNISSLSTSLPTQPTIEGSPLLIEINTNNQAVYRHYNGTAAQANICATIPPATPIVDNEWVATSGNIVIETTALKTANETSGFTGGEKIAQLRHDISLANVTFLTSAGEQTYDTFDFGVYSQTYQHPNIPGANQELEICGNTVFNRSSITLLSAQLSSDLLNPTLGSKTGYIDGSSNIILFKSFPTGTNLDQIDLSLANGCNQLLGAVPSMTWTGNIGSSADLTGEIEVITTNNVSGFVTHEIHLKNVTLTSDRLSFLLATDYVMGQITVAN